MALGKLKEALKDFKTVVKVHPSDSDAKLKLIQCEKEIKRRAFEEAITVDDLHRSVVESLAIPEIQIEPSYDGPVLGEEGVTLDFIKTMMEAFKDQKKLHRKYAYQIMLQAKEVFEKEESLVNIQVPSNGKITVCGDVHGQYYDLLHIFGKIIDLLI